MPERPAAVLTVLARQGLRDARSRMLAFAYLFAIYAYIQPAGYGHTYRTHADRVGFAEGFGANKGLRLLYGMPHDLLSAEGYSAWRVGGVLAIAAAAFGLLGAVRALRAEEDSGRAELVLAGALTRRSVHLAAAAVVGTGIAVLAVAEFAGSAAGGLPVGGCAYFALATATAGAVLAGVGALVSQLAPTRRVALGLGGLVLGVAFVLRVLADTVEPLAWLSWLTPLGWAEQLRPFTGARPAVLVLPLAATTALVLAAARLAAGRDVGTGILPAHDVAEPRLRLLGSPARFAIRAQRVGLTVWVAAVAAFMYLMGIVSDSISTADVPKSAQDQIAKLGGGSIFTPVGYLGLIFVFVVLTVSAYGCALVGALRQEEARQQLETTLALPVSRTSWLGGRLLVALGGLVAVALAAGLAAWAGARAAGVHIAVHRMVEAGVNALPVAVLFLGLAALGYAVAPRASSSLAWALLTVAFLWQLVGSLVGPPRWVLDLTPFAHVAPVPAASVEPLSAAVLSAIGGLAAVLALVAFRRRDLAGE